MYVYCLLIPVEVFMSIELLPYFDLRYLKYA